MNDSHGKRAAVEGKGKSMRQQRLVSGPS